MSNVLELFRAGGPIMAPLVIASCAIWFLAARWWWALRRESRSLGELAECVRQTSRRGDRAERLEALAENGGAYAAALAEYLRDADSPFARQRLEVLLRGAGEGLASPGQYLRVLVHVAPLLGLLGTVVGMVETFGVLTSVGMVEPAALSDGIRCALVTTQAGLVIALPGLYCHDWLRRREARLGVDLNEVRLALAGLEE